MEKGPECFALALSGIQGVWSSNFPVPTSDLLVNQLCASLCCFIVTFRDWASAISLAIQLWDKATGKYRKAAEAKGEWDRILQGRERDL